ncbi:hypothetical protein [Streptococcus oricebi]|uniref:Uncharacterized protein n=1 Tax=Streptococcus oricebi TaxID=1547447 RepID=A0ABS5B321_9STRE|nr:hypothetical protein [Streptococcus oricebi]MBP2622863.1 hypothetical protein [Streptococcus oricebi]
MIIQTFKEGEKKNIYLSISFIEAEKISETNIKMRAERSFLKFQSFRNILEGIHKILEKDFKRWYNAML